MPDAVRNSLFTRLPARWLVYVQLARLDRPIGWWLLLLPCWWSAALAGVAVSHAPSLADLLRFLVGAIAMRGAGSTYNDLVDREIDARVERTRNRPLPSGRISVRAAKMFMLAQCAVGALVLFSMNPFAILLGLGSLAIVAIYPFMKRISSWPQVVLGLAFAYGGLMGWAAAFGSLAWPAMAIYAAAIFWTIGYDTIYALQDARDDVIAGVGSTARLFAANVRLGVGLFYGLAVLAAALAVSGAGGGILSWCGIGAFTAHLVWQLCLVRPGDSSLALALFRSNRDAGLLLFAGLALDGTAAQWMLQAGAPF